MKVLFVSAGIGIENKPSPFILSQGESLKNEGIDLKYFFYPGGSIKNYLKAMMLLRKEINEFKPDIVHAHYSFSGFVSRFQFKVPVVLSFLGSDLNSEAFSSNKILESFIREFSVLFSNRLIVKSKRMAQRINRKCKVIPNGVDFGKFYPVSKEEALKKCNLKSGKIHFLFAANPENSVKNYSLAEKLVKSVQKKKENAELVICFKKPQEVLNLHYNACDFLLLTSVSEGSPNVVKEALATNMPVISTDVGDVPERFEGVSNTYILTGNTEKDTERIVEMIENYSRNNGREMLRDLEISKVAKRIIKVYEEVLKK